MKTNERHWGINLISEARLFISKNHFNKITKLEGEKSLKVSNKTRFPDVLLSCNNEILQEWELKFPDTSINDKELIENAKIKAEALNHNSFLVWNFSIAHLYVKNEEKWEIIKEWDNLKDIKSRDDVSKNMYKSYEMLYEILYDLDYLFNGGELKGSKISDILTGENMFNYLLNDISKLKGSLNQAISKDVDFSDSLEEWWKIEGKNYTDDKLTVLSNLIYISIINKMLFANILKSYYPEIQDSLENLRGKKTSVFDEITNRYNYYNIFSKQLGEEYIDEEVWMEFFDFNDFLLNLNIDFSSNENIIGEVLENLVMRSKRKVVGQFTTPKWLSKFLVAMTLKNRAGNVLDPCCGTGTILKSAIEFKEYLEQPTLEVLDSIWASDKFRYPLQLAMLVLTKPRYINSSYRIFLKDIFDLKVGESLDFKSPSDGEIKGIPLPLFENILSNYPFIQQEDFKKINSKAIPSVQKLILDKTDENYEFNKRSDLYIYMPFKCWELLKEEGRLGIIISNSWLGTETGKRFYKMLLKFYKIKFIISSSKEKWFENADVVTTILILEKREKIISDIKLLNKEKIDFVSLENIKDFDWGKIDELTRNIRTKTKNTKYNLVTYSIEEIENLDRLGILKNSLFHDFKWLNELSDKLIPIKSKFHIQRGLRRGWNKLFYPTGNHQIEEEYLKPLIKNTKKGNYTIKSTAKAFCTVENYENLKEGAKLWVDSFKNIKNGKGIYLEDALKTPNRDWFQIDNSNLGEIVISINPYERIFFSKCLGKSIVDQRVINIRRKDEDKTDLKLELAILNSTIGMLFVESLGFPRGLGALDLSSEKFQENYLMIDTDLFDEETKEEIKILYEKLEKRDVKKVVEELNENDRKKLDMKILESLGVEKHYDDIKASLLSVFKRRVLK